MTVNTAFMSVIKISPCIATYFVIHKPKCAIILTITNADMFAKISKKKYILNAYFFLPNATLKM